MKKFIVILRLVSEVARTVQYVLEDIKDDGKLNGSVSKD